ncbi:hypothetical protein BGX24_003988 [Mortierella sp. AD032]|nr:hypothetical protein BGX24_003988 [Mortierella sp. AD032]
MQPTWLLLLTSTLLFSSHHTSYTSIHAQAPPSIFVPKPRYNAQSVFIEHQKLFINGGLERTDAPPSAQTFYLDLSKNWTTSKPFYVKLADGPANTGATAALGRNKSIWYLTNTTMLLSFNIKFSAWEPPLRLDGLSSRTDLPAVVDPATNMLYIVNGYTGTGTNLGTFRLDTSASPPGISNEAQYSSLIGSFTMTWSTLNNTALIFGGFINNPVITAQNTLYFYRTSSITSAVSVISPVLDSGDRPPARFDHCMVEAYNGTKMILFGGFGQTDQYLDDIYILDVASRKWTKGTPGGPTAARRGASCAVSNDLFIAWGGAVANPEAGSTLTAVGQNITIVYNLKTYQWQDTYSSEPYVFPLPPTVTTRPKSGTGGGGGGAGGAVPTGADGESPKTSMPTPTSIGIVGGAIGGLTMLGIVVVLLSIFCRRRRQYSKDIFHHNVVKGSPHTNPDTPPTMDVTEQQANEDNFYHNVVKDSPHTDRAALPTSDVVGHQVTKDTSYNIIVKGSPHTNPDAIPNTNVTGRQANEDNFFRNVVKGSPHTDPNALLTSNVAGGDVLPLPRYHSGGNNHAGRDQSMTQNPHTSIDAQVLERHPHTTLTLEYIRGPHSSQQ